MAGGYVPGDEAVPGYRLIEFLGRGGFGEVWKASAPGGAQTAIKIIALHGKRGAKEFRALQLVKNIRHPNLVQVTASWLKDAQGRLLDERISDTIDLDDAPTAASAKETIEAESLEQLQRIPAELIIAMGLGDKSLSDRLHECLAQGVEGIPPDELLEYMAEAARAIDFLNSPRHDLGEGPVAIQHRDIKPQNILIVGNAVQVCDFGLARTLSDVTVTQFAGSPAYSPPECLDGNRASPTTDQYSLAVSYVELRTGVLPFDDDSLMGVINAHLQSKLNLSRLTDAEREVIERATSFEPEARFVSARDMVQALRMAYEQGTSGAAPAGTSKAAKPPKPQGTTSSVITMTMPGTDAPKRVKDTTADKPDSKITTVGDPRGTAAGVGGKASATVHSDVAHRTTLPEGDGAGRSGKLATSRHWLVGGATVALLVIAAGGFALYSRGEPDPVTTTENGNDGQGSTADAGEGNAAPSESGSPRAVVDQKLLDDVAGMAGEAERQLALVPAKALENAQAARGRLSAAPAPVDENGLAKRSALAQRLSLVEARAHWRMGDWVAVATSLEPLEQLGGDAAIKDSNYAFLPVLSRFQNARADQRNIDLVRQVVEALGQIGSLQPWEFEKVGQFGDEFVTTVNSRANELANDGRVTEALDLVTVLRRFEDNADSRLLQAEFWLAADQDVNARETLKDLSLRDLDPADQGRAAALGALLALSAQDAGPDTLNRALDAAGNRYAAAGFIGPKSALRRVTARLVTELATREQTNLAYLDSATRFLETLSGAQFDAELAEQVNRARRELIRKRVMVSVGAAEPPDFSTVLADCRQLGERAADDGPVDGLVAAAWTEAAIESGSASRPTAGVDADEIEIDDEFAPYLDYVRLLELANVNQSASSAELGDAIGKFTAAFEVSTAAKAVHAPFRLERAAAIITAWAQQLRKAPASGDKLTAIESPFESADQATLVFERLQPLSKVVEPAQAPPELNTLLALAAWHRKDADPTDAQAKTAVLIDSDALSVADRLPLLYAYAESHRASADEGPAARRAALKGYLTLVTALAEAGSLNDEEAVEIERKIVDRALELDPAVEGDAGKVDAEIAAPLAALYGWRARLMEDHPFADWGEGPLLARRRLEALDRAVALDAGHKLVDVERLVDRGRAELALYQPPDAEQQEADDATKLLDRAEADARAALMADDDDPDASALLAWVQTYRAKLVSGKEPQRVAELMDEAENLYERAVAASDAGTAKARHLAGLSNVYVWWINFSTDPIQRRQELLEKAVASARDATKQNPDYENAWRALGNAEEDLAWIIAPKLIPRTDPSPEVQSRAWTMADERFANAIDAHRRAKLIDPRNALAHFDLGRAMFRSVAEHVHDASAGQTPEAALQARDVLEEAVAAFEQSIALDPDNDQVRFFLARTLAQLGRYAEANEEYAKATELALGAGRREALITGEWASATIAALQSVQPVRSQRAVAAGAEPVLEAAKKCADALEGLPAAMAEEIASLGYHDPRQDAIAIRAYVTALEGDVDGAIASLDKAIPTMPKRVDFDLLLVRAQCYLAAVKAQTKPAQAKALLDKAKADVAAADKLVDRDPLRSFGSLTRLGSFQDVQARVFYQQWKLAPGDQERAYALVAVERPIEDEYQLYHPRAWQWREVACDLLIDDITKGGKAAQAVRIATPRETAQQYLDYARALATDAQDKERLNQLRAELARAKPAK